VQRYIVEILPRGEHAWCRNGLTFDSQKAAEEYATELMARWFGASRFRIVPAPGGCDGCAG